jgi:hypothetical protein
MVTAERLKIALPTGIPMGTYHIGVRLSEKNGDKRRLVELGMSNSLRDTEGFYRVSDIAITDAH